MSETKIGMRLLTDTLKKNFVVRFTSYMLCLIFLTPCWSYLGIATCMNPLQEKQSLEPFFALCHMFSQSLTLGIHL